MENGKQRPLTPADICRQTGLSRQHLRRGLDELERAGLAKRVADDGNRLRRGHVRIYSWAKPRWTGKPENVAARGYKLPGWFPASWEPLKLFINHFKIRLIDDEEVARAYISEGEKLARDYNEVSNRAARFLENVRAEKKKGAPSINERNRKERNNERNSSSAVTTALELRSGQQKTDEEDLPPTWVAFKALYPPDRLDAGKAERLFERLTTADKAQCITQLKVYLLSGRWATRGGQYIPLASRWLRDNWKSEPPPAFDIKDSKAERTRQQIERQAALGRALFGGD
jgi:hypothetical protein